MAQIELTDVAGGDMQDADFLQRVGTQLRGKSVAEMADLIAALNPADLVTLAAAIILQVDADDLTIVDSGGYYTSLTTDGALQEVAENVELLNTPATTESGTTYTVDADDNNQTKRFDNAAQVTVTLPTDASDDLVDGFRALLFAEGVGGLTLDTTGLTLLGSSPNVTIAVNEGLYVEKVTTDTWIVLGGTS